MTHRVFVTNLPLSHSNLDARVIEVGQGLEAGVVAADYCTVAKIGNRSSEIYFEGARNGTEDGRYHHVELPELQIRDHIAPSGLHEFDFKASFLGRDLEQINVRAFDRSSLGVALGVW